MCIILGKVKTQNMEILIVVSFHILGLFFPPPFLLQASLGTTKYCSYFLKNMQCPKPDCMYLHELGDEAASFTKEEMQVVKYCELSNLQKGEDSSL